MGAKWSYEQQCDKAIRHIENIKKLKITLPMKKIMEVNAICDSIEKIFRVEEDATFEKWGR